MITQVRTVENEELTRARILLTPLKQIPAMQPNLNVYAWVTRYNRLRISGGHGVLMFNETA
jgi:hypothetical protein